LTTPLHQRLQQAADALTGERVRLAQLAEVHGSATQGTLLVLLSVPCMLPVPGVGSVLGLGLAMLAWALWCGRVAGQLPPRVAALELSTPWARRVLGLLARFYAMADRCARARLVHLAEPRPGSWQAAKAGLMAVLIVLPIPFGNVLPALALMLLGLGLVFRDGVAVLLSSLLATAAVLCTVGLVVACWVWGVAPLMRWLPQ
jgi:hypothetical protein